MTPEQVIEALKAKDFKENLGSWCVHLVRSDGRAAVVVNNQLGTFVFTPTNLVGDDLVSNGALDEIPELTEI